jgi:hypothetical protein
MVPNRDDIVGFLERDPSRAYCNDCLKEALGMSAVEVTMSTEHLVDTEDERVEVGYGWCSECRHRDFVVKARHTAA